MYRELLDPFYIYDPSGTEFMPLKKSTSKKAFKENVSEMVKAGHPVKQAVAAAYSVKRKAVSKKRK